VFAVGGGLNGSGGKSRRAANGNIASGRIGKKFWSARTNRLRRSVRLRRRRSMPRPFVNGTLSSELTLGDAAIRKGGAPCLVNLDIPVRTMHCAASPTRSSIDRLSHSRLQSVWVSLWAWPAVPLLQAPAAERRDERAPF
jgi:hypothetical protein